jgi:hypothetical protein
MIYLLCHSNSSHPPLLADTISMILQRSGLPVNLYEGLCAVIYF